MVASGKDSSRPAIRMRSQLRDDEICSGMRDSGAVPVLRTVTRARAASCWVGGIETDIEIEAGDGDGLAIGVFDS